MFIEAIDKLRCTNRHEDSWLVAKFVEMQDRDFREGELGCPVCEARYPVREGVVYFTPLRARTFTGLSDLPANQDALFALAAMLDLSAPDRTIVLCGSWTTFALRISEISEPHLFSVNGTPQEMPSERIHQVVSDNAIPLAPGSVDAIALDTGSSEAIIKSAVTALRDGGRLLGKTGIALPADVMPLASDTENWVARKTGGFIPLRRASR